MARASCLEGWGEIKKPGCPHHLLRAEQRKRHSLPGRGGRATRGGNAQAATEAQELRAGRARTGPRLLTFRGRGLHPSSCRRAVRKRRVSGPSGGGHDAVGSSAPQDAAHATPRATEPPGRRPRRQLGFRREDFTPQRLGSCCCACGTARGAVIPAPADGILRATAPSSAGGG